MTNDRIDSGRLRQRIEIQRRTEEHSRQVVEGIRKVVSTAYGSIGTELAAESGN